jgi:hypothetical protein
MNTKLLIRMAVLLIVIALIAGCREITVTTTVNPDGSLERTVAIRGDSSEVMNSRFPTPRDSTWTITREKQEDEDKKHIYRASKTFAGYAAMNTFFDGPDTTLKIRSGVEMKKRFRWFITILRYEEVYRPFNPFRHIPLTEYFTEEELKILYSDEENETVSGKYDEWGSKNMLEDFMIRFIPLAENKTSLSADFIRSRQDRLYRRIENDEFGEGDSAEQMIAALEEIYGVSLDPVAPQIREIVRDIDRKLEFVLDAEGDSYNNIVAMPGLIVDTNADQVEGNRVFWEIKSRKFIDTEYPMWVESRIVNRWAVLLTILLILVPVAFSIYSAVKKGR